MTELLPDPLGDTDGELVIGEGGGSLKSKRSLGARGMKLLEEMTAQGHSIPTVAKKLRMGSATLYRLMKRDSTVREAVDRGRATLEHELVSILLTAARGGDNVAAMFLLKSRHGHRDVGQVVETPGSPTTTVNAENVQVVMSPTMTDTQFAQLLETAKGGGRAVEASAHS